MLIVLERVLQEWARPAVVRGFMKLLWTGHVTSVLNVGETLGM